MSQTLFYVRAKLDPKFVPRPSIRPRFSTGPLKPGLFVRIPCGSSSSARSRTSSRAAIDDLRVAATEMDSFYDLLGISESGTMSEIRQAYKQLVLKYHPDVSPPDRAKEYTKRFIRVQEAYETLSDPTSRASYDRDMATGGRKPFCYKQVYNMARWSGSFGGSFKSMSYKGEAPKKISAMRACPGELEFAGEEIVETDHSI
ncbi:chaperone protein dnaJ 20, chloroplastic [Eucalyptus grandis]|uniref:chaperone protein dnaJ 20, chloroplastic n=1 Tax=Eucalyptus grandis TaxID=71139 RepID=UPI00192EA7D8|nr:chaperone protein dnaJ 20, chloroplastic [Eucalyptus grandis]